MTKPLSLQTLSAIGRILSVILILGLTLVTAIMIYAPELWIKSLCEVNLKLPTDFSPHILYSATIVKWLPLTLMIWVAFELYWLFTMIATGGFFKSYLGQSLRKIGHLILTIALTSFLAHTISFYILSLQYPPGQQLLSISLGANEFFALLLALLFSVFAHLQAELAKLDEENRSII